MDKEPFYFKSYDKVIGVAHNVEELKEEIGRLIHIDKKALEYHLKEGHIAQWLEYIGETRLARKLKKITDPLKAYEVISNYLSKKEDSKSIL
ncbi:MAG: hypothetical protein ACP5GJ_02765 [Nanopusillaceae archaeon]